MRATSKGFSADDHAAANTSEKEEEAVARFLHKTDHLLALAIAGFVLCVGYIVF